MEYARGVVIASWILRVAAAVILLQTLFFKFTGARESVYIFSTLGVEPWGRIASGLVELIAAVLLLMPKTTVLGAGLAAIVMVAAIASHVTKLGITLPAVDDHGELFGLAVVVLLCCATVLYLHRSELPESISGR